MRTNDLFNNDLEDNLIFKEYVGIVVDNNDPKFSSRLKIRVSGINHQIPVKYLSWYKQETQGQGSNIDIPLIGIRVLVKLPKTNQLVVGIVSLVLPCLPQQ